MFTFLPRRVTLCLSVVLLLAVAGPAQAIPPIILHEFTFDTESSRLGVTGGFVGIDEVHGIDGTFGLAIGYQQVFDPPGSISLLPFVSFASVDAVLTRPGLLEGADLDGLLNLTGLEGSVVHGTEHRGLLFTGVDGQGQPMKVRVSVENRQLHLEGENAAGCCDMFNYRLNAFADIPYLMGDIDKDGRVGINDLNMVLSEFGDDVTPMMGGDADWDGYIGIGDLNAVLADWNAGTSGSTSVVVPEPVIAGIILPGIACWLMRRRA